MAAAPGLKARASAPGKLILFGEHSVVYGYTAVAAAISDMRVSAQVELTACGGWLEAVLHDLPSAARTRPFQLRPAPVSTRLSLSTLGTASSSTRSDWRSPTPPSAEQIAALGALLTPEPAEDKEALLPLLFLLSSLLPRCLAADCPFGVKIDVRSSDLPASAQAAQVAKLSRAAGSELAVAERRLELQRESRALWRRGGGSCCALFARSKIGSIGATTHNTSPCGGGDSMWGLHHP